AHDRRKLGDGSRAQVIAVGESARQNDGVKAGDVGRLVPDKVNRLLQDLVERIESVVVAIRSGEDDNTNFHRVATPWGTLIITGDAALRKWRFGNFSGDATCGRA